MEKISQSVDQLVKKIKQLPPWAVATTGVVAGCYVLYKLLNSRDGRLPRDAKGDAPCKFIINGRFISFVPLDSMHGQHPRSHPGESAANKGH